MCSKEGEQGYLAGWSVGFSWDISVELGFSSQQAVTMTSRLSQAPQGVFRLED